MRRFWKAKRAALGLILAAVVGPAFGQVTAFRYQGRLEDSGGAADGLHDMRFRLFDAAVGGAQIGTTLCIDNVGVAGGLFAVQLDFGQQFASTSPRHLEIELRRDVGQTCANSTGFTLLAPRQLITATPRAIHAQSAFALAAADGSPASAVQVDNAGNVGIGTSTPAAKLHINAGDLLAGAPGEEWIFHARSHAGGDFLQITDMDAGVPQWQHGLVLTNAGDIGIGTTAPDSKLHMVNGDFWITGPASNTYANLHQTGLHLIDQPTSHPVAGLIEQCVGCGGLAFINNLAVGGIAAAMWWDRQNSQGVVLANVKNFREQNPLDPATDIWYACIEGPEAAMYARGTASLTAGSATITLPDHFRTLAAEGTLTVILTPLSTDTFGLAAVSKDLAGIEIRELKGGQGSFAFDWEVKAVRKGYEDYRVIRPWDEVEQQEFDRDSLWKARLARSGQLDREEK